MNTSRTHAPRAGDGPRASRVRRDSRVRRASPARRVSPPHPIGATPAVPRGERGAALVLVIVMGFVIMAVWATAWRSTHDTIRAEGFVIDRQARSDDVLRGAADAVDLLRSGQPPSDPYECVFRYNLGGGKRLYVAVTYTGAGTDTWDLEAHVASVDEVQTWPRAPNSF